MFVNQRWFERHDALLAARGASPNSAIVSPSGDAIGWVTNGGIDNPRPAELAPGTRLVRFAGATGLPQMAAAGAWWLLYDQYVLVEQFADRRGLPVPVAMRLLCFVPLEWSDMTMVVQVQLKSALMAYSGLGAPASASNKKTGTKEFLSASQDPTAPRVSQLYIPGLGSADVRHEALAMTGYGYLPAELSKSGYLVRMEASGP